MYITENDIKDYEAFLQNAEKARSTQRRYMKDISALRAWLGGREVSREAVLEYKSFLIDNYSVASVNTKISSINRFWAFLGMDELKVRSIKQQRRIFIEPERELDSSDFRKLLLTARSSNKKQLYMVLVTLGSTGIRISELEYITAEAVRRQMAIIDCKGKHRTVILPEMLCRELEGYMMERGIASGCVFVSRAGNPVDRSNLFKQMKELARMAGVSEKRVFPHNMRHLFARTYYSTYKDIVRLADILGHSNVNTTRIYTMESGDIHKKQIEEIYRKLI